MTENSHPVAAKTPADNASKSAKDSSKSGAPAASANKAAKARSGTKSSGAFLGGGYLAKLALICSLLLAGGLYYLWQSRMVQFAAIQQQLQQIDGQGRQQQQQRVESETRFNRQIDTLQQRQQGLHDALGEMLRTSRHLRQDWLLAEAEYLVDLAGQRLNLAQDVGTALAALQAADERLQDVGDPALIAVRKVLAQDVIALKAVDQPDITGLSLKLSALVIEVDSLRLLTPAPDPEAEDDTPRAGEKIDNWRQLPGAIWRDIRGLVTIRDHQGPIKPLLAPEQHFFLTQNLKLQLEQARLALLNHQRQVYQERLGTATQWINTWFDAEDHRSQQVLQQLQAIGEINIQPPLPSLTRSFQAFKDYHQQQSAPAAQSETPTPQPVTPSTQQVPL